MTVIHPDEGAARVWSVHRVAGHEFGWTARSAQKFMNAAKVFGKNESRNPRAFGTQDTLKADAGPLTSQSPSKARKRGHGNMKEHRSNRSSTREHRSSSWEHVSSGGRGLRNQRVYNPGGWGPQPTAWGPPPEGGAAVYLGGNVHKYRPPPHRHAVLDHAA